MFIVSVLAFKILKIDKKRLPERFSRYFYVVLIIYKAMSAKKGRIYIIVILVSLFSIQAHSQFKTVDDSTNTIMLKADKLKPSLNYSVGTFFLYAPHVGSLSGFTFSPHYTLPINQRLSVEAGIIAGRYNSMFSGFRSEGFKYGSFNDISVYGAASYRVTPQLTLYGTGIKQVAGTTPFFMLPKSSYTIGSTYKFGGFSIGASLQMSKWDNLGPGTMYGSPGYYSSPYPYLPR